MNIGHTVLRSWGLMREQGISRMLSVAISVVEDNHLRFFDRAYGVKTSGFISLEATSIARNDHANLHRYRAVNAWAFREALRLSGADRAGSFVDLGCGLGRGCILASCYGFSRVIGVDIVPEFCDHARSNVRAFERRRRAPSHIEIVHSDAIAFTARAESDVYFMFRPFSGQVLASVLDNIRHSVARRNKGSLVLYSERLLQSNSNHAVFESQPSFVPRFSLTRWGQVFRGYVVSPPPV